MPVRSTTCLYRLQLCKRITTLLGLFLLMAYTKTIAQQETGVDKSPSVTWLTGTGLATDSNRVQDYTAGAGTPVIKNIITFSINEESQTFIPQNFTADITINIEYGHSAYADNVIQRVLHVGYDTTRRSTYPVKQYFSFDGAEHVRITVVSLSRSVNTLSNGVDTRQLLMLQNEMQVTCYYDLSASGNTPNFLTQSATSDALNITWTNQANAGNNGVQLEWSWLENELQSNFYKTGNTVDVDLLFMNNATRVDLPLDINSYSIPLLYDGQGTLYYRIRAVNHKSNGSRMDGSWTSAQTYSFGGHADSLNWQATTSYAEEGKRKTVIQYFDGSLRNRQTVTKDNVTNTTISAETFYDQQGRPAIQVLPVPGSNTIIGYTSHLNLFTAQAMNDDPAKYFDLVATNNLSSFTPTLSNDSSAAAKYYSASNPDINTGFNKNIPNAEGYPYAVTRYTPDGTGRIMAQSGVGAAMKMGSGHETKYYYGSPAQEELDGLFGTEAGDYTHYFKNMVKDANGQMSVSYTDMHGRTIATALAGSAPSGITSLSLNATDYPNQAGTYMTRNLLNANTNIVKNNSSIESVSSILVPATTNYNFTYKLNPQALLLARCAGGLSLSYDCMYNLEISITDESGDYAPIVLKFNNIKSNPDDTVSTPVTRFQNDTTGMVSDTIQFSKILLPGSYSIRKTLTISEASLQQYKDAYVTKALCTTQQLMIDSVVSAALSSSDCNSAPQAPATACQACSDSLGTYAVYRARYVANMDNAAIPVESVIRAAYSSDSAHCKQLCLNTSHTLEAIRSLMLADMIPFTGQYAKDPSTATASSMYNKFDIFSNGLGYQPFRNPVSLSNPLGGRNYYYDVNNTRDASIHPDATSPYSMLDTIHADGFAGLFTYSWAESLLPYHPEYNKLLFSQLHLVASYDWIDNFNQVDTYNDALSGHYLLGSGGFGTNPTDPFFTAPASWGKSDMQNIVCGTGYYGGLNLWQIAYGDVACKSYADSATRADCYKIPRDSTLSGLSGTDKDQAWIVFRGLYKGVRDSMITVYLNQNVPLVDNDANDLVSQGYTLRFGTRSQTIQQYGWGSSFSSTPGAAPTVSMKDSIAAINTSRCGSYINQWRQALLQCPAVVALDPTVRENLLTEVTDSMLSVCNRGIDVANPYGSSTVSPSAPYNSSPRNFEEAINMVFAKSPYNISRDLYCNPFMIESPKPYGKGPLFAKLYISALDSCGCAQFSALKQAAYNSEYDPTVLSSFNSYLRTTYGDTLTADLYNAMQNNCGNNLQQTICYQDPNNGHNYICHDTTVSYALKVPQPMPAFLQCGYTGPKKCLTCDSIRSLTKQFKTYFTSPYNTAPVLKDSLDSAGIAYNMLYARFINARTGLQFTWQEYAKAASAVSCVLSDSTGLGTTPATVLCPDTHALNDTAGLFLRESPCQETIDRAIALAISLYQARKQQLLDDFEARYRAACMAAKDSEQFTVSDTVKEYHYTLYYYDMAGNLVKTVPPKGVKPDFSNAYTASVDSARVAGTTKVPSHTFLTNYRYNSLNQVVSQQTPDAGVSGFWYDLLGRLTVSQNAQQSADGTYSYTLYDDLGRITEVGQKTQSTAITQVITQDPASLNNWLVVNTGIRAQITATVYDVPYTPLISQYITQQNLRNRVSYTYTKKLLTDDLQFAASFYTYDVHGNVDTLLQDYAGVTGTGGSDRFKRICYQYDLISGKINMVSYQPGLTDAFYHRYSYDAENRVTEVETSRDKIIWEREAAYSYYKHGPLARTVLGQEDVQGLDYSYTLQGWLKGINPVFGKAVTDSTLPYASESYPVARDVYGFSLHYYNGDYKPIGSASTAAGVLATLSTNAAPLYNGNITAMGVNIPKLGDAKVYNYHYDQLNRLKQMDTYNLLSSNNGTITLTATSDYKEQVGYDPNGNIVGYLRNGTTASGHLAMDSLTYGYYANTNQLKHIKDTVSSGNYSNDIDDQSNAANYTYDAIGNLKTDLAEGITGIYWTVYGKIDSIAKTSGSIKYGYDAAGNRISKTVNGKTTMYVRDATGNVMSVYEIVSAVVKQTELHMYGSSRLGLVNDTILPQSVTLSGGFGSATQRIFTRGKKVFELSNHLGNVLATITDRKIAISSTTNSSLIDHYEADVSSVQDYYPFGMLMNGRNLTSPVCRDSTEDFSVVVATSDLNSGATSSGGNVTHNGVTWKPYSTGNGTITLFNQGIKVDATSTSGGVVAVLPSTAVAPNTVYLVEFDITDKTSGVTSFFCQLQSSTNTGQPYRVLTQKTGLGHYALLCTMPATYDFLRLRISSVQAGTGQYFVVDNLVARKLPQSTEAQQYSTDMNTATMNGVNVNDNGQIWIPFSGTTTSLSVAGTTDKKIKVTPTTTNDSQVSTDFNELGGKDYIARFSLAQDSATKRIYLDVYSRTGGTWSLTDSRSVISLGSGDYMLNYTLPTGADGVRFLFRRSTDAPTIPYTIDNFNINRLDTIGRLTVSACSVGDTSTSYRYGFNGKENDNEVKGQGNEQDYGMRIYDPRAGRFLSVDPLTTKFPQLTPYQFASNTPIRAIDLDGLESVDANTGKTDNTLNPQSASTYQNNKDAKPWQDLIGFTVDTKVVDLMKNRFMLNPSILHIESAAGSELNLDYYSTTITKLPNNMNATQLQDYIRKNFSSFINDDHMVFNALDKEEGKVWNSNTPVSAVMSFKQDIFFNSYTEGASVLASKVNTNFWTFSTLFTPLREGSHPVSGTRQFGLVESNITGATTYTFFTRGADRTTAPADAMFSGMMWSGADKVWNRLIKNVANFVIANGGQAWINEKISKRISWKKDYLPTLEK